VKVGDKVVLARLAATQKRSSPGVAVRTRCRSASTMRRCRLPAAYLTGEVGLARRATGGEMLSTERPAAGWPRSILASWVARIATAPSERKRAFQRLWRRSRAPPNGSAKRRS
jgi:hypothetical protein